MIQRIYSIRDAAAEYYMQLILQKTEGEAIRTFTTLVRDQNTSIAQNPEHYDLYYLGEFDDCEGKITTLDTPRHIMKAVHAKAVTDM